MNSVVEGGLQVARSVSQQPRARRATVERRFPNRGARPDSGHPLRVVDRHVIHGGFLTGAELFSRLITPHTRYLVLDLDRTFHLRRNLGEVLGWDLAAINSYGEDYVAGTDIARGTKRFLIPKDRPLGVIHYFTRSARLWAYPGLLYLACTKLTHRHPGATRLLQRVLGPDPVAASQHVVRVALMHQLAEAPLDVLRRRAEQIWARLAVDQVIEREELDQLRARCPHLKIILSSASPQPMLEAAGAALGVDHIVYTAIEEDSGYLSAPHLQSPLFMMLRKPRRIAPPASFQENVHFAKIRHLLTRFPDLLDPGVETVGVTDTSHGEDYDWSSFFTRVADVNSPTPFPSLVAQQSPLREIHSCHLLTRYEKERRRLDPDYHDPRRGDVLPGSATVTHRAERLRAELSGSLQCLEELARQYALVFDETGEGRASLDLQLAGLDDEIAALVGRYNEAPSDQQKAIDGQLRKCLRKQGRLHARRRRLEWQMTTIGSRIERELQASRHTVAGLVD